MAQRHARLEAPGSGSLTKVAVGLAAAAVLAMVILGAADADGPIWIVQGALAAAAALVGWRAGGATRQNVLASGALIVGAVLFVVFVIFAIAEA